MSTAVKASLTTNHISSLANHTRAWEVMGQVPNSMGVVGEQKMSLILPSPGSIRSEPGRNAILARLLSDAVEALECDAERARAALFRAVALVGETHTAATSTCRGGLASWQAQRTMAFIDEHLEGGTRIIELAGNVRLSPSHFCRAFKEFFGCSPKQFILERRIQRALELMLATDSSLCDIAQVCGFADQAHFSRMFRKFVGITPNAWRRARAIG
jgi:AraC family transcriptional regulator